MRITFLERKRLRADVAVPCGTLDKKLFQDFDFICSQRDADRETCRSVFALILGIVAQVILLSLVDSPRFAQRSV